MFMKEKWLSSKTQYVYEELLILHNNKKDYQKN